MKDAKIKAACAESPGNRPACEDGNKDDGAEKVTEVKDSNAEGEEEEGIEVDQEIEVGFGVFVIMINLCNVPLCHMIMIFKSI